MGPVAAVHVAAARPDDAAELAAVAARTFPLACPPDAAPENIAAFVEANLSADQFGEYVADADHDVLVAVQDGRIIGYCMLIRGVPADDADVAAAVTIRPTVELSKMYVLPDHHGTGAAEALMNAALEHAAAMAAKSVWLGVNQHNRRAQRFYAKHGFTVNGTKVFHLGPGVEDDYVMVRPI